MKASVGLGGGPALSEPSFTDRSLAGVAVVVAAEGSNVESSRKPSGAEAQAGSAPVAVGERALDSAGALGTAEPATLALAAQAARRLDLLGGSELSTIQEASTRAASGTSINQITLLLYCVLSIKYPYCSFECLSFVLFVGATEILAKRATGEQMSPDFEATASNDLTAEALPSPIQRPRAAKQTLRGKRVNATKRTQKKRPSRVKVKTGRRLKGWEEEEESSSSSETVSGDGDEDEEDDGEEESDSESERMSGPSAQSESGDGDGPSEDAQSSSESTVTTDASSLAELASPARLEFLQRTHSLRAFPFMKIFYFYSIFASLSLVIPTFYLCICISCI